MGEFCLQLRGYSGLPGHTLHLRLKIIYLLICFKQLGFCCLALIESISRHIPLGYPLVLQRSHKRHNNGVTHLKIPLPILVGLLVQRCLRKSTFSDIVNCGQKAAKFGQTESTCIADGAQAGGFPCPTAGEVNLYIAVLMF